MKNRIKTLLASLVLVTTCATLKAQDSVVYRVILLGDAGQINKQQTSLLDFAAGRVIPNKTTVMYLGGNVYPHGVSGEDDDKGQKVLKSQYQPMRAKGAPVYFIPGSQDWNGTGQQGLEAVKAQWALLESQQDSLVKLVPQNGCADPVEIPVNDKMVIIAFDSEWWLYPHNKDNKGADCNCKTPTDIVNKIQELYYRNRGKFILLASNHPFQTYGSRGGIFPNPEDINHPSYKDMIAEIDTIFSGYPDLVHVASHDQGLQFIKNPKGDVQVISSIGSAHVKQGQYALFAGNQGFVTADLLVDGSLRFTYYTYNDAGVKQAFVYTQPYKSVKPLQEKQYQTPTTDSVVAQMHPKYDSVGNFHRKIFGENYRKEWAAKVKFPYLKLSELHGGLTPEERGGGKQTQTLHMVDATGKKWTLRTVEKDANRIVPDELKGTLLSGLLDDAVSAQNPYGALVVPPIADAVKVPHTNPVIGVVAPDKNLGQYAETFVGKVCLLEERQPLGKSDNTEKMQKALAKDNDNHLKAKEVARARMLDVVIGDWDRHEDQWGWYDEKKGSGKDFAAVPKDRDQVLYTVQGPVEYLAGRRWVLPTLQGFGPQIKDVRYSMFKSRFVNWYPEMQFSHEEWMKIANGIKKDITDSVIDAAMRRLPPEIYRLRGDTLARMMKARRDALPAAMDEYYRFLYRIVDIKLSDKNEKVALSDAPNGGMQVTVNKISKKGKVDDELMSLAYDPQYTKEIRIFTADGDDQVVVDNKQSDIKVRIVGGKGNKDYEVVNSKNTVDLYGLPKNETFKGDSSRFATHFNTDTGTAAIHQTNRYSYFMPQVTGAINRDDGFQLGLGFKYFGQNGFRTFPYATTQKVILLHSFTTNAFRFEYAGEWIHAVGNADFLMNADIMAPNNTTNFFGRGNNSVYDQTKDYPIYYRIRFNQAFFSPALRWKFSKNVTFSTGPSLQYYHLNPGENVGRFINDTPLIGSYDSTTVNKDKLHAGVVTELIADGRDNPLLPTSGYYLDIKMQGYGGLNSYSKSYGQIIPEFAVYQSLGRSERIVFTDRVGGGVTIGQSAFYQSLFLGGQGNLLGYRINRFAGQHMAYNNFEMRIKLGDFTNYVIPGQFGISGFYDVGRVWEENEDSDNWHNGYGGGIYFAPAKLAVLQLQAGRSIEGWYPSFSFGFRF